MFGLILLLYSSKTALKFFFFFSGEEERRKNLEFSLFWSVIFSENLDVFESEDLGTGNCDFRHLWFELDWKW